MKGKIYANIWRSHLMAMIDPKGGKPPGWIDLRSHSLAGGPQSPAAVLNGIAYDAADERLFVSGKLWPKRFEIQFVAPHQHNPVKTPPGSGPSESPLWVDLGRTTLRA